MTFSQDPFWWPFAFILIAGSLTTMGWRWLAVALASDVDENSDLMLFVRCLSNALVAAVIAQLVFFPTGALALAPLWVRAGAALVGFTVGVWRGSLILGILVGEGVLLALYLALV